MTAHRKCEQYIKTQSLSPTISHVLFINSRPIDNILMKVIIELDSIPIAAQFAGNVSEGLAYLHLSRDTKEFPQHIFIDEKMDIKEPEEFLKGFMKDFSEHCHLVDIHILTSLINPHNEKQISEYEIVKSYTERPFDVEGLINLIQGICT